MYQVSTRRPEADDLPHGPFEDVEWRENYQWLAMDPSEIGVILHLGTHPDDGRLWHSLCAVSFPDGRVLVAKSVGSPPEDRAAGSPLHFSRCVTAFDAWDIVGRGGFQPTTFVELAEGPLRDRPTVPVSVDLHFAAFGPVWDPAGDSGHPEWGAFHHEQPMRVTGEITVAGAAHTFDGFGYRDHSRGPRDMREVSHSHWSNGVFPSGRTFCTLQVHRLGGDVQTRAAILHPSGDQEDVTMVAVPDLHDAAHNPVAISVSLVDASGTRHDIQGRVAGGATWSIVGTSEFCLGAAMDVPDAYILPQSIVRWEWDGEVGYGLSDRCSRAARLRTLADQAVPSTLHSVSRPETMWTTANVAEAVPGLLTPLTWSLWIAAQPYWDQGFNDMGVITDDELGRDLVPDACNMAVFFGRAVMNVEMLRMYADRMPGGSANAAEAAIAGAVRPGVTDNPDEAIRAVAAERLPVVGARYGAEMQALFEEADATWKRWLGVGVDDANWRTILATGADLFFRAQRYQGMATMFVQGAYSMLAMLAAELGEPGAENTLVAGDAGLDENRLLALLWAVGRGEARLEDFVAEFGFHGPDEGSVESPSWREQPELLEATLAAYASAGIEQSPQAATVRVAAARDAALARLCAVSTPAQVESLRALVGQAAALMPLRELGKATFLRGIDLVRLAVRHAGAALAQTGAIGTAEDIWLATIAELQADPIAASREALAARRAERDSYRRITLPAVFQGQPEPAPPAPATNGTGPVTGMGASPGVVEGTVRVLASPADEIAPGDVVVTTLTDPSWVPLFLLAGAIVVDVGGALSHAAIVAREVGIPCVIGTGDGTSRLRTGDRVEVDGTAGTVTVLGARR